MSSIWRGGQLGLSIFGQSHSAGLGMTLDGVSAGERVDLSKLRAFLARRAPGRFPWSTSRKEADLPEFICGLVGEVSCGAPITAIIRNRNTRSADYATIADIPRPGHADFPAHIKYGGHQDVFGGGHFSGRLTAALCIAGGICLQILERRGITIGAHIAKIGDISDAFDPRQPEQITADTLTALHGMPLPLLNPGKASLVAMEIEDTKSERDSVGGTVECAAIGLPTGLGQPIFGGMENRISSLAFGIPAVKGIEFGAGFAAGGMLGSENNDPYYMDEGSVKTRTNNHGGILGGITTGMPLVFRVAFKPTPSIAMEQESISLSRGENAALAVRGRHDPCIVPRAVPVVEAVTAIAIYDAILEREGNKPQTKRSEPK